MYTEKTEGQKLIAGLVLSSLIFLAVVAVFHFWLYDTAINVMTDIEWINVTETFAASFYWLVIGLFVLKWVMSVKFTF